MGAKFFDITNDPMIDMAKNVKCFNILATVDQSNHPKISPWYAVSVTSLILLGKVYF